MAFRFDGSNGKGVYGLGVNADLVRPELYKLLLYEPGGFFKKHRDTEKAEGMFATLVIQLPSRFTGGSFIVSHNGKSETFPLAQQSTAPYYCQCVAFYADCEHEILPVESGYRLALVYSLCYTGSEASKPSIADLDGESLVSNIKRLDPRDSLFSVPLKHQYTSMSLARLGVGALKGDDRTIAQNISRVNGWEMIVATVEKTDHEWGEGHGYRWGFEVYETEQGEPTLIDLFDKDGGDASAHKRWLSCQLRLHSWEDGGTILATKDECKKMWGKGEEGTVEYTGNEGANRETKYAMCILVAFSSEGVFERQCQSNFSDAMEEVRRNPVFIDRLLKYIEDSNQVVSSEHFVTLHPLIERHDSYWESFNVIFQGLSKSMVPTAGVLSILTSMIKKFGWSHDKLTPIRSFLAQLPNTSKSADALADQLVALESISTHAPPADVYLLRQSILESFVGLVEGKPPVSNDYHNYVVIARQTVWKSLKIEAIARELISFGTPALFERIEAWASTASLSILSEADSVFRKIDSSNIQAAHAVAKDKCVNQLHRRCRELKVAALREQENELLTKTQGGAPIFSWSMPNAMSGNAALDAFLHSSQTGPSEVVVGGGISNARGLADERKSYGGCGSNAAAAMYFLSRGYSADLRSTDRIGSRASVIVTKTKGLHKALVNAYHSNVKALADVRAELDKLGVRSGEGVPEQPVAKRAKSDPEVIVLD